jgi:hypothetical protein
MVGTQEYEPTGLQIQVLCTFIEAVNRGEQADPITLLDAMGKAKTNWYNWLKKEGFMSWWNQAIDEYFSGHGLKEVHASIYRNAVKSGANSSADRKLYLERFDDKYKPATKTEIWAGQVQENIRNEDEAIKEAIATGRALDNAPDALAGLDGPEPLNDTKEAKFLPPAGAEQRQEDHGNEPEISEDD